METLSFTATKWNNHRVTQIPNELLSCKKVWVRVDRVKRPLEAPYFGPYVVVDRKDNFFTIQFPSGRIDTVSIDRLKPVNERVVEDCGERSRRLTLNKIAKTLTNNDLQEDDFVTAIPENTDDKPDI